MWTLGKKNEVMGIWNSSLFRIPLVTLVFEAFALCWGCLGRNVVLFIKVTQFDGCLIVHSKNP
jgi:hypothetical protein